MGTGWDETLPILKSFKLFIVDELLDIRSHVLSLVLAQELLLVHNLLIVVVDYGDGRSNVVICKWVCRGFASRLARGASRNDVGVDRGLVQA